MRHKNQLFFRRLFSKSKTIPGKLVLIALMLGLFGVANAQKKEQLPKEKPPVQDAEKALFSEAREADVAADQSKVLDAIKAQATTKQVRIVRLDLALLNQAKAVILNVLPGTEITMSEATIDKRSDADFTWTGTNRKANSEATLVVKQNNVIGTIRSGKEKYFVRPIGGGLHAIIDVDETKFPSDHPPEYQELEQKSQNERGDVYLPPREPLQDEGVVVNTLVAYTPAVTTALGSAAAVEGLIQVAVDETNHSYANSNVVLRLNLVHAYETSYNESGNMVTDRDRFRIASDGFMDEVHTLRNRHNADIAILVTNSGGFCGIASAILADDNTAFAVVHKDCATGNYSFGHEIGHLLGARHNPEADATTTPFAYGHGYFFETGGWRTVMSYNCPGGCTRLPYWSDPMVEFSGVAMGTAGTHNNARVLTETAPIIANFRRTDAPADRVGYVWANNPTAASYTPSSAYSFNSAGAPITITRSASGQYQVTFSELGGSGIFGGNVQVTAYGSGSEICKVVSWASGGGNFVVNVRCFTAAGAAVDTRYTVLANWPR